MTTASVTYTFVAGASAAAAQVNTNFADLVGFLNTNALQKDGSLAMTGRLTLAGLDPTSGDHAARKSYVDNKFRIASATTSGLETRFSSSYGDLSGGATGPAVTLTTGTEAYVALSCAASTVVDTIFMAVAVTGATTLAAADSRAARALQPDGEANNHSLCRVFKITGLNAGSNIFTAKYKTNGGQLGSWQERDITVWTTT